MRKSIKRRKIIMIKEYSSRLEEYLEIVFLQIRDLSMLNGKENDQVEFFLTAWLDEDREQIQRTEVSYFIDHS